MSDSQQDREQGMIDKAKGKVKETVGDLAGDNSTKYSGKLDSLKGEAREKMADIKDQLGGNKTDEQTRQ
jgi:uncharacterized protein YjbJ (UPF0337 family)